MHAKVVGQVNNVDIFIAVLLMNTGLTFIFES